MLEREGVSDANTELEPTQKRVDTPTGYNANLGHWVMVWARLGVDWTGVGDSDTKNREEKKNSCDNHGEGNSRLCLSKGGK